MISGKKAALVAAYQRLGRTIRQAQFFNLLPRAPRDNIPRQGNRECWRRIHQGKSGTGGPAHLVLELAVGDPLCGCRQCVIKRGPVHRRENLEIGDTRCGCPACERARIDYLISEDPQRFGLSWEEGRRYAR